ncbi:MAG: permease-like cell division protein FtsX [Cyclobacteriaceae bacterium]
MKKKKKLGSYPFLSVVFSIFLTLFVIGIFGFILLNAAALKTYLRENVELQVYLRKNISENELAKINKTLSAKDYVLVKDQIPQIRSISKEEAAEQFIKDTGEDFVQFLGENPLRDVIVLKISEPYHTPDSLEMIRKDIVQQSSVFEVAYAQNLIKSINDNIAIIVLFLVGFALILLIAAIVLINNTIKLALFSQRFLIRSMQLVGATSGFIQKPFLKRAVWYGFISGVIASGLLFLMITYANTLIEKLAELQSPRNLGILFGGILLLGVIVGFGSSYIAVRKYMKLSLDELY